MNGDCASSAGASSESAPPQYPTQERPLERVDTVAVSGITPEEFFEKYVKRRIPVKLRGCIADPCWNGSAWRDLDYLDSKCGQCLVKIEKRGNPDAYPTAFGNGLEKHVSFSEFLSAIRSGDESLYLTTQKLGYSAEGEPDIVSPPLTALQGEYPWRPSLMGNLVTQNINIWIGRSAEGTCSGLHHDHHDNLYLLLRGAKSFKLFSPAELPCMYVNGEVSRVHPNGRINYSDQPTRADGADVNASKALSASIRLDQLASQAEVDSDAEDEIDAALEDLLDAHMEGSEEEGDWSESGDSGSEPEPEDAAGCGEGGVEAFLGIRKRKMEEDAEGAGKRPRLESCDRPHGAAEEDEAPVAPPNFSKVVTSLPEEVLKEKYPKFLDARRRQLDVSLNEGEMLYLPCGWFHEVTSRSGPGADAQSGFHMAANYWFHPPDGATFEAPYADPFWPESWKRRMLQNQK